MTSTTTTGRNTPGVAQETMTSLSQLLPTGTFLTFQALAPLFTNNGVCGEPEKLMTGILLFIFFALCFLLNFVDSVTTESGKIYYGFVSRIGLYNPQFKKSNIPGDLKKGDAYFTGGDGNKDYFIRKSDFLNGFLDVLAFGALSLLTPPVTTCYYPQIPDTIVKTLPILVALIIGIFFAFCPSGRHGVGFAVTANGFSLVPDNSTDDGSNSSSKTPSELKPVNTTMTTSTTVDILHATKTTSLTNSPVASGTNALFPSHV